MARVTNLSRAGMDFVVGIKGGEPVTEHIKSGETRDIDIDPESAQVKGRLAAGTISVGRVTPSKVQPRAPRVEPSE